MKTIFGAALVAVACALSGSAMATPIAMTGAFGTANMGNATYNATFSGATFLPADYSVNSLTYSFTFTDDASDAMTVSAPRVDSATASAYAWEKGVLNVTYGRNVAINQTVTRTGEQETAALSIGGIAVASGGTALSTSSAKSVTTSRTHDYDDCFLFCDYYYSNNTITTTTVTQDWTGAFTISGTITNKDILAQLLSNDQLQLSLKVAGDLVLTGAQMAVDFTPAATAAVPEPSSILLTLAALGGIGAARRRRVHRA